MIPTQVIVNICMTFFWLVFFRYLYLNNGERHFETIFLARTP